MNSTKIIVRDFVIPARIGIYPEEHLSKQRIIVNVTMELRQYAIEKDAIENTVSYEGIVEEIRIQSDNHHNLVETLAENLAEFCLRDDRVKTVEVQIEKPDIIKEGRVGCQITRSRD